MGRLRASKFVPVLVSFAISTTILGIVSFFQYAKYGSQLFLGWDTPTYVWWAQRVLALGPIHTILQGYPNLYVLILAGIGFLYVGTGLAERVVPFVCAGTLSYSYFRLTSAITSDSKIGYLAALTGSIVLNTLRLFSDLHRNLLTLGVSMLLGAMIATSIPQRDFVWSGRSKAPWIVWLPLLAIVAYAQIETYVVLSLTLALLFASTRNLKVLSSGVVILVLPMAVALPIIQPFINNYVIGLQVAGPAPAVTLTEFIGFLGGYAIPWVALGIVSLAFGARTNMRSRFVSLWLCSLALLAVPGFFLNVPLHRLLFVVPVPIVVCAAFPRALSIFRTIVSHFGPSFRVITGSIKQGVAMRTLTSFLIACLIVPIIFTSYPAYDQYLRPYVAQGDINRIEEATQLVQSLGYSQPIFVMYGPKAANLNPIYRAYFGIQIPDSYAYYGKLQFLFTLPDPHQQNWRYNPSFEIANALKYRTEILDAFGTAQAITNHAVVVVTGATYGNPLSENFLGSFERAPGIYIIPPDTLSPSEIDNWRLFAFSDWTTRNEGYAGNATWAISPSVLEWAGQPSSPSFEASYQFGLAGSWPQMQMLAHIWDWQQPYKYPDGSNATLAPVEFYVDGNLTEVYNYGGSGPLTLSWPLGAMSQGMHTLTVRSGGPGLGVAMRLDQISICPISC